MKILIFDYNEDFYPLFERKLRELPFVDLSFSKDLDSTLAYLQKDKFDCILMNHLFYEKFDYYSKIREEGYKGDIIVTVAGKKKSIKRMYYNGIKGVLDKSLNGNDFREAFCKMLHLNDIILS